MQSRNQREGRYAGRYKGGHFRIPAVMRKFNRLPLRMPSSIFARIFACMVKVEHTE